MIGDPEIAILMERVSKRYKGGRPPPTVPVPFPFPARTKPRRDESMQEGDEDDDEELPRDDEEGDELEEDLRSPDEVWALRDVSLEVAAGTSLGIIGPNGAGKTTLLKTLARITPPTEGRIVVRGRIAPLLSTVSAFLQPDMTGRQNVFGLARFFGVPRVVAERNMEEIFAFADLERLIDAKAGTYSSGEYQRFGFSAALHLEPDILLAQDKFAVGDAAFRDRALERLEEASRSGLTMLYASHDMKQIERFCDEVIWMEEGRIVERGPLSDVAARWERLRSAQPASRQAAASDEQKATLAGSGPLDQDSPEAMPDRDPASSEGAGGGPVREPRPRRDCALFAEFLNVAIGEYETGRGLAQATRRAMEEGSRLVHWYHLADAVGYDRLQAKQIAARLSERDLSETAQPPRQVFNEHLAIVSGRLISARGELVEAVRVDEDVWLQVMLEAATSELTVRCSLVLISSDGERIKLVQPRGFVIEEPKSCAVFVRVPVGMLREALYRCKVIAKTVKDGRAGFVQRSNVLEFEVYEPDQAAAEDREELEERPPPDELELEWRVKA